MKRCASFAACFIFLLFTSVLTGPVPAMSSGRTNEAKTIIVGAILPFTGAQADIASEERNAIEMALDDTGRKFKVIYEDSAGQNSVAMDAFHKIVEKNNASVVITCASWISNFISPPCSKYRHSSVCPRHSHLQPDR